MVRANQGPIIRQEQATVRYVIGLYCWKKHRQPKHKLCAACQELQHYAITRLTQCRYGEQKSTCEKCPTHCYAKHYRQQIKKVMRFAGPRMLLYHPVLAIRHWYKNIRHHN